MKIKAAKAYVLGIKKTRLFFFGVLVVLLSLVFLSNGLLLIHTALFSYSDWSLHMKFIIALLLGFSELLGAAGVLFFLFREKTWMDFSEIKKIVNAVIK